MTDPNQTGQLAAVVGAGPAGIYAARHLTNSGVTVALLNRDIKPGGLAEYGIYYDKFKMKEGLRRQFRQILPQPGLTYFGNVPVGEGGAITLAELRALGFAGILVTVGAQGTKWLGLPGEDARGVYHAKDIVYHYNRLPPFSSQDFAIGRRVALIGVGNVMLDIAHWLVHDLQVEEIIAVARRGPAEVKFSKKEMELVARNLDLAALQAEIARCAPVMAAVKQDPAAAQAYILAALAKAAESTSATRFLFDFLASPTRILSDAQGRVCGLEVEDTTLIEAGGDTKARGLGTHRTLDVDTVIFCIGDRVDEHFGLPVKGNEFVKNPNPQYPVDGLSYEVYDLVAGHALEGIFVAGWSREASSGLVGVARKDGENGARALWQYLQAHPGSVDPAQGLAALQDRLTRAGCRPVTLADVQRLEAVEAVEAQRLGLEEFKFKSNAAMLEAITAGELAG